MTDRYAEAEAVTMFAASAHVAELLGWCPECLTPIPHDAGEVCPDPACPMSQEGGLRRQPTL